MTILERKMRVGRPARLLGVLCCVATLLAMPARADSVEQINAGSKVALDTLQNHIDGVGSLLKDSAGVLVFSDVVRLGFGVGGEFGEGVLLVKGEPQAYYATSGAPYGLPKGDHIKSKVIVFRTDEALASFRELLSWNPDAAASMLLFESGPEPVFNGRDISEPVVGFLFSNEAMLDNPTLTGAKITRLAR